MKRTILFFAALCMTFISFFLIGSEVLAQPMKVNYAIAGTSSPAVLQANAITSTSQYQLAIAGKQQTSAQSKHFATLTHLDVQGVVNQSFRYRNASSDNSIAFNTIVSDGTSTYVAGRDKQMLVAKIDPSTGMAAWSHLYGGRNIRSMILVNDNGVPTLVTLGAMRQSSSPDHDLVVLKINPSNGTMIDARQIGNKINGTDVKDVPAQIIAFDDGFVITATVDHNKLFVAKLNRQLNTVWKGLYKSAGPLVVKDVVASMGDKTLTVIADTKVNNQDAGFMFSFEGDGAPIQSAYFSIYSPTGQPQPTRVGAIAANPENGRDTYLVSGNYSDSNLTSQSFVMKLGTNPNGKLWVNDYGIRLGSGSEQLNDLLLVGNSPYFFSLGTIRKVGQSRMLLVRPRLDTGVTDRGLGLCYTKVDAKFKSIRLSENTNVYENKLPDQLQKHPLKAVPFDWNDDYCTTSSFCHDCPQATIVGSNLIQNENFNAGDVGFSSNLSPVLPPNGLVNGDYSVRNSSNLINPDWQAIDHTLGATNGLFMTCDGNRTATDDDWVQTVSVLPNTTYWFCAALKNLVIPSFSGPGYVDPVVEIEINGTVIGPPMTLTRHTNPRQWDNVNVSWNSGSAITARIVIRSTAVASVGNDYAIDDISFVGCESFTDPVNPPSGN